MLTLHTTTTAAVLFSLLFLFSSATSSRQSRRLLHQPFFSPTSLNPSPSPLSSPLRNTTATPKISSTSSSSSATTPVPFFPTFPTSPPPPPLPPPPPPSNLLPSFPANISSLALPSSPSSSSSRPVSPKLLTLLIFLSFIAVSLLAALVILTRRKTRRKFQNAKLSDVASPPKISRTSVSNPSSEFLYLGTLGGNSGEYDHHLAAMDGTSSVPEVYIKLCGGSPELRPLPPLPKQSFHASFEHHFDDEEFFSPRGFHSTSHPEESENLELNSSENLEYESSGSSPSRDSDVSVEIIELAKRTGNFPTQRVKSATPRPPAPPPPAPVKGPPALVPPSGPIVFRKSGPVGERESIVRKEEMLGKTKLKGLYWDKVRASSDRVMVWDQLLPGSFQLNEEMIETLFKANGPNVGIKDGVRRSVIPVLNEETRVLDPKKSQNIAILLRALNVTEEEVCQALLEGNADSLGTELLESLLKMAPTIEEERKLKEYKDEPPLKLGPAEKFLKAVLEVPYAFKRVDAMLYIASFDSEVEYLKRSFETLEAACHELRNSRTFLKLLEAVLKTGNRMNVGTNRGDAQAIKLDTLLKLADIKGTDGKTTLLHFVVQEIIKAEGSRLSPNKKTNSIDDVELRKRGLEVVSSVVGELMNVKKAATMDKDILSSDVSKLVQGIVKVSAMKELMQESKFSESMEGFLSKAEAEITRVQSSEIGAFSKVKELTEYFHGSSVKEEAHPLRIFLVVRDFLRVLDQVCKEVGKVNERTIISNMSRQSVRQTFPPPFPELHETTPEISLDDESNTP